MYTIYINGVRLDSEDDASLAIIACTLIETMTATPVTTPDEPTPTRELHTYKCTSCGKHGQSKTRMTICGKCRRHGKKAKK